MARSDHDAGHGPTCRNAKASTGVGQAGQQMHPDTGPARTRPPRGRTRPTGVARHSRCTTPAWPRRASVRQPAGQRRGRARSPSGSSGSAPPRLRRAARPCRTSAVPRTGRPAPPRPARPRRSRPRRAAPASSARSRSSGSAAVQALARARRSRRIALTAARIAASSTPRPAAARPGQHLLVVELLLRTARRRRWSPATGQHLGTEVAGGYRFQRRRHADQVGAHGRSILISAGVSYCGPGSAAYTPSARPGRGSGRARSRAE